MKRTLRNIIGMVVRASGLSFILREIVWPRRATIVVYHDPAPEVLQRHLSYLARRYTFIPLEQLVHAIHESDWASIPSKAMVLTFDDGHRRNADLTEVLTRFNVRPTIYLCSDIVGTSRRFWWKSGISNLNALKRLPEAEMWLQLKQEAGFDKDREYPERQALSQEELKTLQSCADFGSHSRYHPILTQCRKHVCADEIAGSRRVLQELLDQSVSDFCYPNGAYGNREVELVRQAGYRSARTLDWGRNGENTDVYRLKVVEFLDDTSINDIAATLVGVFALFRRIRAGLRRSDD